MRAEAKTQRELLNTLGELPAPVTPRWFDRWKAKTLENRHVAVLLVALTLLLLVGFVVFASKRNVNAFSGHHAEEHIYHAIHFSRDRPLEVMVIGDLPPVDNDDAAWNALITKWDSSMGLVVVTSPNVRISRLQRLDALLKVLSRPSSTKPPTQATWFFAAQYAADNNGVAYAPSSPRMMVTCTFHSLVFGHEVEFMSAIRSQSTKLRVRLAEGQGEVNSRFVILPAAAVAQSDALARQLKEVSPLTIVWTNPEATSIMTRMVADGPIVSSAFETTARKPCVVRPFDVSDYRWKCAFVPFS